MTIHCINSPAVPVSRDAFGRAVWVAPFDGVIERSETWPGKPEITIHGRLSTISIARNKIDSEDSIFFSVFFNDNPNRSWITMQSRQVNAIPFSKGAFVTFTHRTILWVKTAEKTG